MNRKYLEQKAAEVRRGILNLVYRSKSGHIGGSLSSADIMTALYYELMNIDSSDPENPDRDRFILSKGHCIEGYLYILADKGFIDFDELNTYYMFGSRLIGHPSREIPGIEMNTGALGHGLSCACGMALAAKMNKQPYRTYVLMGDGELEEGSIWEAAMLAANYSLDNLYVIVDRNNLQISGFTEDVMCLEPLKAKWESFGFCTAEIDGNDLSQIVDTFHGFYTVKCKPKLLIANTIKGKGISFMENKSCWHQSIPNDEQYVRAMDELRTKEEELS